MSYNLTITKTNKRELENPINSTSKRRFFDILTLPTELLLKIFSFLPTQDILQAKNCCKTLDKVAALHFSDLLRPEKYTFLTTIFSFMSTLLPYQAPLADFLRSQCGEISIDSCSQLQSYYEQLASGIASNSKSFSFDQFSWLVQQCKGSISPHFAIILQTALAYKASSETGLDQFDLLVKPLVSILSIDWLKKLVFDHQHDESEKSVMLVSMAKYLAGSKNFVKLHTLVGQVDNQYRDPMLRRVAYYFYETKNLDAWEAAESSLSLIQDPEIWASVFNDIFSTLLDLGKQEEAFFLLETTDEDIVDDTLYSYIFLKCMNDAGDPTQLLALAQKIKNPEKKEDILSSIDDYRQRKAIS